MAIPSLTKLRPGQTPTAAQWNAMVDALSALMRPSGTGEVEVVPSVMGTAVLDRSRKEIWTRIGSDRVGCRYSHQQVNVWRDGDKTDQTQEYGGAVGTSELLPAVEVNERTDVPSGAIVRAWPSGDGEYFEFDAAGVRLGTLSGPSGPGGYNTVCWYSSFEIDGICYLVRYCLTGIDLTLGMEIVE